MRLDAFGILMEDRADCQIALRGAKRFFDLHELQIVVPLGAASIRVESAKFG
jgi:hypothetical protein